MKILLRGLCGGAAAILAIPLAAQQTSRENVSPDTKDASTLGETIELSPFTVSTTKDKGYFAENTLAGSRMNTNVSDLGASISVVTKQLLEDTASIDINDVFRYEINTEGSSTYTPAVSSFRPDGVLDVIAGGTQGNAVASYTNSTANRVRGIGVPSFAINNYPAISQVPMDTYNVQRLEISRGPNSMLFGMGSPAGIVNQSSSAAALDRDSNTVTIRGDHNGSHRASFGFNRALIKGKLAIYGAALYSNEQFERKPSYDISKRAYGAITFRPFEKTRITANIEGYENRNRRPNTISPRDFVTEWRASGMPTYDSATQMITIGATGQQIGPYVSDAAHPSAQLVRNYIINRPDYNPALRGTSATNFNGTNSNFTFYNGVQIFGNTAMTNTGSILFVPGIAPVNTRTTMQIADGQVYGYFSPTYNNRPASGWGTATDPRGTNPQFPASNAAVWANAAWADVFNRQFLSSAGRPGPTNISNYRVPGVTDQSIYDWEEININQSNFGRDTNTTYNVEIDQEILSNLHLNAGWFRQDFLSHTNYTLGQLNSAAIFVDPNARLPDGSPNPFFGKPFVEDWDPDRYRTSQLNDSYRAMLAYTPDFTRQSNWLRWLGRHQILGMWSRDENDGTAWRLRPAYIQAESLGGKYRFLNNQNSNADGSPSGWAFQQTNVIRRLFYLASPDDPFGTGVTQSQGEFNALNYTGNVRAYNYQNSAFEDYNTTWAFNAFDSPSRNQRIVNSLSAGMTSYLWNDRLVATLGVRRDDYKARSNAGAGAYVDEDGVSHPQVPLPERFTNGVLNSDLVLNRWRPWDRLSGTTKTMGAVFRPFRNWSAIDQRAAGGSIFWEFLRDFGVSYNRSDNFNPPPGAQVDLFGKSLPKPSGEGQDIGIQFSLFNNKVFARVTWFEASNENERAPEGNALNRLRNSFDTNLFRGWAYTIARINMGDDPRVAASWDAPISPEKDLQLQADAAKIWKIPFNYYNELSGTPALTRNADAKGVEAQVNYNPTPNWTLRATFGKQDTVYDSVLKELDAWIANRRPVWETAKATDHLLPQYQQLATYQTEGGRSVDLTNFLTSHDFHSDVRSDDRFGNTNVQNYYNITVQPNINLARDLEGQRAPGQRRYRGSIMTNYKFTKGRLAGFDVGGVQRWEDKMIIGYYGKASGADLNNPTRLDQSDVNRPIWDSANFYTDLWVAYTCRFFDERVRMRVQLNVANVFESGELRVVSIDYAGNPNGYRIIDPRKYTLTATFDF